jgi:hypothetical protein
MDGQMVQLNGSFLSSSLPPPTGLAPLEVDAQMKLMLKLWKRGRIQGQECLKQVLLPRLVTLICSDEVRLKMICSLERNH